MNKRNFIFSFFTGTRAVTLQVIFATICDPSRDEEEEEEEKCVSKKKKKGKNEKKNK